MPIKSDAAAEWMTNPMPKIRTGPLIRNEADLDRIVRMGPRRPSRAEPRRAPRVMIPDGEPIGR